MIHPINTKLNLFFELVGVEHSSLNAIFTERYQMNVFKLVGRDIDRHGSILFGVTPHNQKILMKHMKWDTKNHPKQN